MRIDPRARPVQGEFILVHGAGEREEKQRKRERATERASLFNHFVYETRAIMNDCGVIEAVAACVFSRSNENGSCESSARDGGETAGAFVKTPSSTVRERDEFSH